MESSQGWLLFFAEFSCFDKLEFARGDASLRPAPRATSAQGYGCAYLYEGGFWKTLYRQTLQKAPSQRCAQPCPWAELSPKVTEKVVTLTPQIPVFHHLFKALSQFWGLMRLAMRPAKPEMGMVWSRTRPGPVTTVLNMPSPPKSAFLTPLICSTSIFTVASIIAR